MTDRNLPVEAVPLDEVVELSFALARQILESSYQPDLIVAIARGGFTPARFLCDFLNVRAMASVSVRHYSAAAIKEAKAYVLYPLNAEVAGKKVLLVDDVNDTGDTLEMAIQHVRDQSPAQFKTAVLHEKSTTSIRCDFKVVTVKDWHWILYPWARTEDVGGLIAREYAGIREIPLLQQRLREDHGMEIPADSLEKILALYPLAYR